MRPTSRSLAMPILLGSLLPAMPGHVLAAGSGDRLSIERHMEIQRPPQIDPTLQGLPSIKIDIIQSSVPVDDRLDADAAFDRPFVEALEDGMAWYLGRRGLPIGDDGELRLTGMIEDYEGWKGWGHWGVEVLFKMKLYRGSDLVLSEMIRSYLKYSDDEDVVDEEAPKYKAVDRRVSFIEVLFTRVGIDLNEKLITLLKERAGDLGAAGPATASPDEAGYGRLTIDASAPHAEVQLDDMLVGTTPLNELRLAAGPHTIDVRKTGFTPWQRKIVVLEGATSRLFAELAAAPEEKDDDAP